MKNRLFPLILILSLWSVTSCNSQNAQSPRHTEPTDRQPAVAGQFYPAEREQLQTMLHQLFSRAVPPKHLKNVIAIISPHAGYPYSGEVAASSFNQIDPEKEYENIFILGPSHHIGFEGASLYSQGNFVTPLGTVKVNTRLARELIRKHKFLSDRVDAHQSEHSIEVQLPFLQTVMKKDFRIVPVVVGSGSAEMYAQIAEALRPYLNSRNLFVISTDFSHYPAYADAVTVDKATGDAVLTNSPGNLMKTVRANAQKNIPNLATSMCGLSGVLTLLYMTQDNPLVTYTAIQYKNSGDADPGLRQQVVGYHAITVSLQERAAGGGFSLTEKEKGDLLRIARTALDEYLQDRRLPEIDASILSETITAKCGAFVTLTQNGQLRGCIGRFDASEPLYKVVQQMSVAAATEDPRFDPVEARELNKLEIEISVLTPLRRIHSIDEIEMGKHGIYLRKGLRSGTFLPQVATDTHWTKEEFLGHCAQDKAGLGWNGWKDAEIYVYEAIVFSEKEVLKH
ncbi:MAG: AmmeMemoRadiSam system protein B [Acidobacteriia bacterium]|nr:AmmeMemoRadiSam system protein B [Terriglobia bacterium]